MPTRRSSEREPAVSLTDKSNVIGGWLPSLTFAWGLMRIISSIVAVIVLMSLPLALRIWQEVDPNFSSRDQIVNPLAILFGLTGAIAAFVAIALATKRRPVAVGFGVYGILHGAGCLYLTWRWGYSPGLFDILAGVSICVGLRALMMMRKKHDNAA